MNAKKYFLAFGVFLLFQIADAADVTFEAKNKIDKDFLETNRIWISGQYAKLESYFHTEKTKSLTVQVMPVSENPDFTSCARIYGIKRIYAHSPASLKELNSEQRKKYNSFCFERNYKDLKYTLVHEYVHILTLSETETKLPMWIWEGAAVALSGQLQHTEMGTLAKEKIKSQKAINVCKFQFSEPDSYLLGGAIISVYELRSPNFIFEFIKFLAKSSSSSVEDFLKQKKLPCVMKAQEILAAM